MAPQNKPRRAASDDKQALEQMLKRQHEPLRPPPQLAQKQRPPAPQTQRSPQPAPAPRIGQQSRQPAAIPQVRQRSHQAALDDVAGPRRRAASQTGLPSRPSLQFVEVLNERDFARAVPPIRSVTVPRRASNDVHWQGGPQFASAGGASSLGDLFNGHAWLVALVALLSIATLVLLSSPTRTVISGITLPNGEPLVSAPAQPVAALPQTPTGEHSILGAPTITAAQIDAVLTKYGSPAAGTGAMWVEMGAQYNINPAYALAFFIHESSAATAPAWAGWKGDGSSTHNVGNIICAGYDTCHGRFRDYPGWREGINDWYRLIAREYVEGRGVFTIEQIIPIYAPSFENDVSAYVNAVTKLVKEWQQ